MKRVFRSSSIITFLLFSCSVVVLVNGNSNSQRLSIPRSKIIKQAHDPFKITKSTSSLLAVDVLRGGGSSDFYDSDDYDNESSDFDFDMMDDDMEGLDDDMNSFEDDSSLTQIVEAFHKTPPLTKVYLSCSMAATLYGYLTSKTKEFPEILLLDWNAIVTKGQIWRPLTCFLNFGPFGFGYIMTAHFVWTYMSTLERLNYDHPYDFWMMIFFGQVTMLIGYFFLGVSSKFLGHNLSTFLVYIWSRYHEGLEVNMMELFNTRAELLPWFFLAQTALLEGEFPLLDLMGILFGHIYHHCKTTHVLKTPDAIKRWYRNDNNKYSKIIREQYKQISADFELA
eukprot:CAMPEP_0178965384 /NCGR_PEP_ID=MMETSP0789-20121207/16251_1 /TAXON_ID=3005 /ORGANISM="Rhizosolenia setigera, Strain CCMP 1694" /LENGTH=337 /DNA_ID=CAMNT_0020650361 /DNA_START=102 /DNA_END=1115 /DNA_ORIENTATION=-